MLGRVKAAFDRLINFNKPVEEPAPEVTWKDNFPDVFFADGSFATPECSFGGNNSIFHNAFISNAFVGRFTYICRNCVIHNSTIGSFCSIGPDVLMGLGRHPSSKFVSTYPAFYSVENSGCRVSFTETQLYDEVLPINIGNDVWIGARAIISDGVKIGDGAIIGAGAVVTEDVEPYAVVGGIPAKHIRYRFEPHQIELLLSIKWWNRDVEWIKKNASLFVDINLFKLENFHET